MLDIEKNKKNFTHMYEYYKERINTVEYPEYELNKNNLLNLDNIPL